jgi:hypothetical protein
MAANKKFRFGPIALTATLTTNLLNPPTAAGGVNAGSSSQYILIYWLKWVNKTAGAITHTTYLGATGANAAGTELSVAESVPANSTVEKYFPSGLRLDAADFLVGGASAGTSLTLYGGGEIGVSG